MQTHIDSLVREATQFPVQILTKILIVEDEAVVALHLQRELTKLGYTVVGIASRGEQVIPMVEERFPDVILMDIHIQGPMDGIDTAKLIPRYLHIPVIFLTAFSEDSTLARAKEALPYGYLIKPFSERELHATIGMAIERSQADAAIKENEGRLFQALCCTPLNNC